MGLAKRFLLLLGLFALSNARAGDALDVLQGYDKAHWGQSMGEIKAIYGDKVVGWSSPSSASKSDDLPPARPMMTTLTVTAAAPFAQISFYFMDDKMCWAVAEFSSGTAAATNEEEVARVLWAKYYADPAVQAKLEEHHLLVRVGPSNGMPPHPANADDLMPQNGWANSVTYMNGGLRDQIDAEATARRQKAIEQVAAKVNLRESL